MNVLLWTIFLLVSWFNNVALVLHSKLLMTIRDLTHSTDPRTQDSFFQPEPNKSTASTLSDKQRTIFQKYIIIWLSTVALKCVGAIQSCDLALASMLNSMLKNIATLRYMNERSAPYFSVLPRILFTYLYLQSSFKFFKMWLHFSEYPKIMLSFPPLKGTSNIRNRSGECFVFWGIGTESIEFSPLISDCDQYINVKCTREG